MLPILLTLLLGCNLDSPLAYDAGVQTSWTVADVDHDGEADVVARSGLNVTVAYGTAGDGFEPPRVVATFRTPAGIMAAADVDGDGDGLRDLLVHRGQESLGVVLLRNRGGRAFGDPELVLPGPTGTVRLVDIEGDGDLDLTAQVGRGEILVTFNDGRGHFHAAVRGPGALYWPALGDFNGDGFADFLSLAPAVGQILRGDGWGFFLPQQTFEVSHETYIPAAGDLNGDRYTDAIIPDRQRNRIEIRFGSLEGLGSPAAWYDLPARPLEPRLIDLDGDGDNDVLVEYEGTRVATAFLNDGRGHLTKAGDLPGMTAQLLVRFADTNLDGFPDLLAGVFGPGGTIVVARGLGDGRFHAPETRVIAAYWFRRLADVDGDGADDLLTIDRNPTLTITYARGGTEQLPISGDFSNVFVAEVTSAPGRELLVAKHNQLTVFERHNGQWSAAMTIPGLGMPYDVVNVDTRQLVITWGDAYIEAYDVPLANRLRWRAELAPSVGGSLIAGDFSGDGISDLLVTGTGTWPTSPFEPGPQRDGYLSLFAGRGDGTYSAERPIFSSDSLLPAVAGDFDGDRDLDVVVGLRRGGDTVLLRNDGRGGFGAPEVIEDQTEQDSIRYAAGDLNADGIDDLVVARGFLIVVLRFGSPEGFVVRPPVLGRAYTLRIAGGRLSLFGLDTLTTIAVTCDGRRRPAGR